MDPNEYCKEKAARAGTSLHYAFLFLPLERRRAAIALHAFSREIGDTIAKTTEISVARVKLAWWRTQVDQLFAGQTSHPVMIALAPHVQPYGITAERMHAVIDGMETDLDQSGYPDWPSLQSYCWHAAGVVGEMAAGVFGYTDPGTLVYAEKMGLALRLTNIIRGVGDDARRGRIYLPADDMERFGVAPTDILNGRYTDQFLALMRFETQRARDCYREAMRMLPDADRRSQRPGLMMASIYHTLLDELERDQWHVLDQRIGLTPIRKFWLAWSGWVGGGRSIVRRLSH